MKWRGGGVILLGATTGACSLFISVPTDEYSNGAPTSGPDGPDAASSNRDGSPDVASPKACDATFCEDFDDGPLGAKWPQQKTESGELSLVPSTVGPPNALRVRLPQRAGDSERSAFLARDFPFPAQVRCELDVFAGAGPRDGRDIEVLGLRAGNDGSYYSLHLKLQQNVLEVREGITSFATTSSEIARGAPNTWMHIVLDAEMGNRATISVGEMTTSIALRPFASANLTLSVGESGDNDGWGFEVLLDNVACTFTR